MSSSIVTPVRCTTRADSSLDTITIEGSGRSRINLASMHPFFALRKKSSKESLRLRIDYSLDKVRDPFRFMHSPVDANSFFADFQFSLRGGSVAEDSIVNDVGWYIVSERVRKV